MAAHSNIVAWRIPWTEEPGGLQSMRSQRVGHDCSNLANLAPALQADSLPSEPPGNDRLLKETATKINILQRIIASSRVFKTNTHNVQDTVQNSHNAKIKCDRDFPGSTADKSLPAKVGDKAPCATTTEPMLQSPGEATELASPGAHAPQRSPCKEKLTHCN